MNLYEMSPEQRAQLFDQAYSRLCQQFACEKQAQINVNAATTGATIIPALVTVVSALPPAPPVTTQLLSENGDEKPVEEVVKKTK